MHENSTLRARQAVLRESAFDLAGRVIEEGYRPRRPAPDIGNEALLTWLSEQGARFAALECEIAAPMSNAAETLKTTR